MEYGDEAEPIQKSSLGAFLDGESEPTERTAASFVYSAPPLLITLHRPSSDDLLSGEENVSPEMRQRGRKKKAADTIQIK